MVLWIITRTGELYCVECAAKLEITGAEVGTDIRQGDPSFGADQCDRCGKHVGETVNGEIAA